MTKIITTGSCPVLAPVAVANRWEPKHFMVEFPTASNEPIHLTFAVNCALDTDKGRESLYVAARSFDQPGDATTIVAKLMTTICSLFGMDITKIDESTLANAFFIGLGIAIENVYTAEGVIPVDANSSEEDTIKLSTLEQTVNALQTF